MVQLATFITAIAAVIPAVSAVCHCDPNLNFCGYELLNGTFGCQPSDLPTSISTDIYNSLYKCTSNGVDVLQIQYCGGPGLCNPKQACGGVDSCCKV
ncbi:hypothetical protein F5Y10DRAFT_266202 [Nemania abortiva]|nr:hypothetical protein F5Y10DRAFT_266202 [Nemania abortiva]